LESYAYYVVSGLLLAALFGNLYLICVTFRRCQSEMRYYFVLSMAAVFCYTLGHFFEITAKSAGASATGIKIMYMGSCFMSPLFLFFVIDYCRVDIGKKLLNMLKIPLFGIPLINLALVWTFENHDLIYKTYFFDADDPLRGLQIIPGTLYSFSNIYSAVCIVAICTILITRLFQWHKTHRKTLILMIVSAAAPGISNAFYFLSVYAFNWKFNFNFLPFTLVAVNLIFYLTIVRYNLFDFVPIAYHTALDSVDDACLIVDAQMNCMESNNSAKLLFPGIETYRNGLSVSHIANWPEELFDLKEATERETTRFRIPSDGDKIFSASVNAIADVRGNTLGWIVLMQNITTTENLMRDLELAAYTDALTGLYNRRHFVEIALMEFDKAKRMELPCYGIIFDLDFFKKVNDTYGHLAGDEVLRCVSATVRDTVRSYDLLARYGGEEFVIFLSSMTDTDDRVALNLAERVRQNVENMTIFYEGTKIKITLSLGVARGSEANTLEDLLKNADTAMYSAKQGGRNRVVMFN
jgi:diguanylate cyclase (GGDEF)-like protein